MPIDDAVRSEGLRRERVVASKQYGDGVFHNTNGARDGVSGGMGPMLREWLFGGQERRPKVTLPLDRPHEITELDWFESAVVGGVRFTATPSQHFSGRAVGGRNKTLWASWVIESEKHKVFFSGDTGLTTEFEAIGRAYGPFDLVMLEIGAFHPSWGTIHLGPENALAAFRMLGGGTLLPVHWGTFSLGFHAWNEPGEQLLDLAPKQSAHILTPRLGQPFEPTHLDGPTPWWRDLVSARDREALLAAK